MPDVPDADTVAWATAHFDPVDQDRLQDPYPVYAALRECGIAHSDAHLERGFYVLSRYEDVVAAGRDHELFQSGPSFSIPSLGAPLPLLPVEANRPRHTAIRRMVNEPLAPQAVADYERPMREHTAELVEGLAARGEADLVRELSFHVPARAMFRPPLMGHPIAVDGDDWIATFQGWVHTLKHDPEHSAEAGQAILDYLERLLSAREAEPQDDLPSHLLGLVAAGEDLTREEVLGMLFVFFMGGIETPANAISLMLLHLARDPDTWEFVRTRPDGAASAVEEILRFYGPSQGVRRTLSEDACFAGQQMKAGDAVWLLYNSADRDADAFEDADTVRLDRFPNRHLGFGVGIHRCSGSHLARLMMRVVLEEVVARAPRFHVIDESALRWSMGVSRSLESLPVRFEEQR